MGESEIRSFREMKIHSSFLIPHFVSVLLLAFSFFSSLFAGTITGKALFEGSPGENQKIDMAADPVCSSLHPEGLFDERVVVNQNKTLKNIFVYLKNVKIR